MHRRREVFVPKGIDLEFPVRSATLPNLSYTQKDLTIILAFNRSRFSEETTERVIKLNTFVLFLRDIMQTSFFMGMHTKEQLLSLGD